METEQVWFQFAPCTEPDEVKAQTEVDATTAVTDGEAGEVTAVEP